MENWVNKKIELGVVSPGRELTIVFQANKDLNILNINPSCGCTKVKYDPKTRTLTANVTPDPVPMHLMSIGRYVLSKSIRITYADKQAETLSFKGTVEA